MAVFNHAWLLTHVTRTGEALALCIVVPGRKMTNQKLNSFVADDFMARYHTRWPGNPSWTDVGMDVHGKRQMKLNLLNGSQYMLTQLPLMGL